MYTTLNKIREHSPCTDGWRKLLKHLKKQNPDDESLSLLTILDLNGLNDTLWCLRAVEGFEKEKLLLALTYAREVEHLMPAESKKSLDVFEQYANGLATQEAFEAARKAAADAAARAVDDDAAWFAARAACAAAVYAAACDATYAAGAWSAAATTRSTIRVKQETQLRELLERTK